MGALANKYLILKGSVIFMRGLMKGPNGEKGFTLKDTNKNGKYYVYIWGEYDNDFSNIKRRSGHRGYSKVHGWRSLGSYSKNETIERLKAYLEMKFGNNQAVFDEWITEEYEVAERRRIELEKEQFNDIMVKIETYHYHYPDVDINYSTELNYYTARKLYMTLLKNQVNKYRDRLKIKIKLPTTMKRREELIKELEINYGEL